MYELPPPSPNFHSHHATVNEAEDRCINPEGFASFIGLESHDTDSQNGYSDYSMPNLRYVLKKSFQSGSFGEVWLAFHGNYNQDNNVAKGSRDNTNTRNNTTTSDCQNDPSNYTVYIMKCITVEMGSTIYLSGLREKNFGEVFLNPLLARKSNCLGMIITVWF